MLFTTNETHSRVLSLCTHVTIPTIALLHILGLASNGVALIDDWWRPVPYRNDSLMDGSIVDATETK